MSDVQFERVDGKDVGDIKIFALSTCGWCKKTKAFLADHGYAFAFVDVDLLEGAAKDAAKTMQQQYNPRGSFPTIVYNQQTPVIGYDLDFLNGLAEK